MIRPRDVGCVMFGPRCSPTPATRFTIAQEEIFGPVLTVIPYTDEDGPWPLPTTAITVWPARWDQGCGARTGDLPAGSAPVPTNVNMYMLDISSPFGGFKKSGGGGNLLIRRGGLAEYTGCNRWSARLPPEFLVDDAQPGRCGHRLPDPAASPGPVGGRGYADFTIFGAQRRVLRHLAEQHLPNAACDVPHTSIPFSFAPNPYWNEDVRHSIGDHGIPEGVAGVITDWADTCGPTPRSWRAGLGRR